MDSLKNKHNKTTLVFIYPPNFENSCPIYPYYEHFFYDLNKKKN